jgi:hypothetical protein
MGRTDINEERKEIVDSRCPMHFIESGKTQKDHNKHFDHDKVIPDADPRCVFGIRDFFEGADPESALVGLSSITDP